MFFLLSVPADQAEKLLRERTAEPIAPSEKTIRRHYKRIGLALYERLFEPIMWNQVPWLAELRKSDPEKYRIEAERVLQIMHEWFITKRQSEFDSGLAWQDVMPGYRAVSNRKKGIRDSIREHMGLAALWAYARNWGGENRVVGYQMSNDVFLELFKMVATMLKEKPC